MGMELRQFTYVRMVAECGSITKAAAKLFISQPALSNYINKVEEELGVKLFDRSANPLILTYAGEQYLQRAKGILSQIEDMDRQMRDITHHMEGRIRIGFPNERIIYMLPLILPLLKERYPGIDVEVANGSGHQLMESLRAGNVDFIFLPIFLPGREPGKVPGRAGRSAGNNVGKSEGKDMGKDVVRDVVAREEVLLVTAKGYLSDEYILDRDGKIADWEKAAALPIITLQKGHALRSFVDELYRGIGEKQNIVLESHSNMLSYRLAAQGLGIAVVPELTLELMKGSMEADVYHLAKEPVTWEVCAVYREGCYIGEVERALIDITKNVMADKER